jgi:hypothetical protein
MRKTAALAVVGMGVFARGAMGSAGTSGSCTIVERCLGAIKTGFVADAASMGLHWIYDVEKIKALTKGAKDNRPEFFEPHKFSKVPHVVTFCSVIVLGH